MVNRQPEGAAHASRLGYDGPDAEAVLDDGQIVHQVAVAEHHPFGPAGGAGGVLQEGDGGRRDFAGPPAGVILRGDEGGVQPVEGGQLGRLGETLLDIA